MKKKLLLFLMLFCIFFVHENIKAQSLERGDIAFIGYQTGTTTDGFTFITLKEIPSGTLIYFTDKGWGNGTWIVNTESHLLWTVPINTPAGTIISVLETSANTFTVTGTQQSSITMPIPGGGFNLSGGDQILAYQSSTGAEPAAPFFIAGVHGDFNSMKYDNSSTWNTVSGATGGPESVIPPDLTNGLNCISLFPAPGPEYPNAKYTGTLTGTKTSLLSSINNPTNWVNDNNDVPDLSVLNILPTDYTTPNISTVVVPSVTTTAPVTNYGALTATLAGSNTDGGDTVLSRGIVWSLMPNPVIGGPGVNNLAASIGTGPFSVNATSLPSGTTIHYAAYASNSAGITYGTPASFSTNAPLSATQSQTNACNGVNNGTATVTPSGGKSPYTYAWSNGSTAATITGLMPSNYSVNITDSEGTTTSKIFTIGQDSAIQGGISVTTVSCFGGNNGAIDLTPTGGSGSYTYNWGGGITTQDRTGLVAGTYSVTITDSNNCSLTISNIAVGQPAAAVSGTTAPTNVACNGGNTGAINLTPTGGTGPYTFLWNDGITTEDRTGLTAGAYSVTITDSKGCSATISNIPVTQPPALSGSIVPTHVACFGGNTGAINLTPSGGVGPYTFAWSDGPTTEDRTGLTAGTYTVTITDSNSCSKTLPSFTINQPSALGGTTVVTNASCFGGSNGAINLTPTGGAGPYTFNWVGGASTEDRNGLPAGTYAVTITDANGCTATISNIAVGQPAAPLDGAVSVTPILCNGSNTGAINLTPSGGTSPYTFDWGGGVTTEDRTGLAAGTYSVTITDGHGCTKTISNIQVTQPSAIATPITITHIACNGAATGAIDITPSGGVGPYTFLWNDGVTSEDRTGLTAGTYSVTITDSSLCSKTFNNIAVTQPSALGGSVSVNNVSCNGGSNGSIGLTPTGGVSPYTYSWNGGVTTQNRFGLMAGTYSVTITDNNSCSITISNILVSQPPALVISIEKINVSCNGGSNGSATVTATGGTGNYSYQWSPSGGNAATASGLQAGTYTVTVTDENNCQNSQQVIIGEPSILDATQAQTDVLCNGGSTGTATVTPIGGAGDYTYVWSPTGGTAATATGLSAGTYTCKITDKNGCFITRTFTINQPSVLNATTSQTDATCSVGGEATVVPTGGVGGYTYSWSPSGGASATATGLSAGNYQCQITDGNGCSIIKNFTINTTNTLVANTTQVDVLCNGANTGSITVTPSGAPGPFTYEWTPNVGNADTVNNLTAGNYSVKIISSNGCSIIKNFTIAEPSAIVITLASQSNVTCKDGNNGSITPAITGGTGAVTYSWNTNPVQTSATATGLKAGTYTLTVTDANSCIKTRNFTITEPDALTATTSQTNVSCNGGSNGTATVNVTGGTGDYTYSWSPSGGTAATANGLAAGTYTVTIKDDNLCQTTASVTISQPDALTATIAKTDVLCHQANNGTATVTPAGGTGDYTYSWSPSGGTAATATGLSPNTYTVTVTDANGCFVTESVQITEPTALSATYSHTNVSCNGGNNGTASVTAIGGTGNYTYSWSPSGGTAATATGLAAGTYNVTVTDENSCFISSTITITQPDALALTTTPVAVTCHNGNNGQAPVSATGGSGDYTHSWSPAGGNAATASGLTAGTYTVTVTDANSCTASATVEITQPANPVNLITAVVSGVTTTGASLSGTASSNGINTDSGSCLTEVGFVYAQHANPTIADTKINVTAALGTFANTLSGLRGNRTYYVRTYTINSNGFVSYGNEVSFTTQKYTLTITAAAGHTKVYGTADPVFNYTALGFVNGDTNSILTGLLSRDAGENVGKYNIKPGTINAGADYVIAFTGAEFEITKANQTITWNQTLEFGCADSNTVALTATTDSGLPVSYAIANAALGTISGSTLNIKGSGSSTITATQNGDQNHNAATAIVKPIEISQSGLVIQQWANVLFFDNRSNNYVAWQWYKNGAAISGATRQYYSELQPLNGTYHVIAKDKNGNSIKSCPIETTGTVFTKKIKIYPNPVKPGAEFTLECDFSESQLNGAEVVIYDIAGKLVQTISNVKAKNQIIAPSQTALYIVVLKLADGQLKTINLLVK